MDVILLLKRIGAFFLVPILLLVGMAFVQALHTVMVELVSGIGIDDLFGINFLVTLLSAAAFVGLCWALYWWVAQGGPGVFDEW